MAIKFWHKKDLQKMSNYKLEEIVIELGGAENCYLPALSRIELENKTLETINQYHAQQVYYICRDWEEAHKQVAEWNLKGSK